MGKHRQPYKLFNTPLRWKMRYWQNKWRWFTKPKLRNKIANIERTIRRYL